MDGSDEVKDSVADAVEKLLVALSEQGVIGEHQSRECLKGRAYSPQQLRGLLGLCCKREEPDDEVSEGVFLIESVEGTALYISDFLTTGEIGVSHSHNLN